MNLTPFSLVQLQVDAAIEAAAGRTGAHVVDPVALAPVIDGEQRFQLLPTYAGQGIALPVANVLESVHAAPLRNYVGVDANAKTKNRPELAPEKSTLTPIFHGEMYLTPFSEHG